MPTPTRRRPSASLLIALLALFVALGGPAEARRLIDGKLLRSGSVTGKKIKDRSLTTRDLGRAAIRKLQRLPPGSVTRVQIANGQVTSAELAAASVGSAAVVDRSLGGIDLGIGSVTGAEVADSSLDARDVGRFWGRFRATVGPVTPGSCWSGEPVGLAPERAAASVATDVVLVTPGQAWPDRALSFSVRSSANPSRFVLMACNPGGATVGAIDVDFSYVVIDVP